jgi:SAM-dependent methyltransferase/AcrR family transcriptional regulator
VDVSIKNIMSELVDKFDLSEERIAAQMGVSASAVYRWAAGKSLPRPSTEGRLRELHSLVCEQGARYRVPSQVELHLIGDTEVRTRLDRLLRNLREAFHRRSRLSGRNDALDEVTRLLFAHVTSLANTGRGISNVAVTTHTGTTLAEQLKAFVAAATSHYLPDSLAHEIKPSEFDLRLTPTESALAKEIISYFEEFSQQPGLVGPGGIEVVDLLNEVFGKFLADSFTQEKELGQYLTPTEVVRFMVQLALSSLQREEFELLTDPERCRDFGFVLDPSCGVGSFLAEFVRAAHARVHGRLPSAKEESWLYGLIREVIVGVDKSERMIRYALTNLAMFGLPAVNLMLADALSVTGEEGSRLEALNGRVSLILTNPPFGAEFRGKEANHYTIARSVPNARLNSELLFLERYLKWLRPGGQVLVIVPDSVLTNRGTYELLRQQLEPEVQIRGVISLPSVTFGLAGTFTKTSILHLMKQRKARGKTFVAVCQDIGYTITTRGAQRIKQVHGPGDLPLILDLALHSKEEPGRARYVDEAAKHARWDAGYHLVPESSVNPIRSRSKGLRVRDVAELKSERIDPRRQPGFFKYIEISDVDLASCMANAKALPTSEAPSRARKRVRAGDVLFSTVRPERRAVAVVLAEQDNAVCTTGFAVLKPKRIHPMLLALLLRHEYVSAQIVRHNSGIAYPAIDESCLLDVILPVNARDLTTLEGLASDLLGREEEVRTYRTKVQQALESILLEPLSLLQPR